MNLVTYAGLIIIVIITIILLHIEKIKNKK